MTTRRPRLTLIGAGLAGCLLAVLLRQRGWPVTVCERHPDPRRGDAPTGRSINLALAERGREAVKRAGLLETVEEFALPMAGRMLHEESGNTRLQRYGQAAGERIWSVHRGRLNACLLDAAEHAGADLRFGHALEHADFESGTLTFRTDAGDVEQEFRAALGCDGAGSALRRAMESAGDMHVREEPLGHGYKELSIPPDADGGFRMEPEALHIWPRGGFMMIALPNPDASFTCTLFLPDDGDPGFRTLAEPAAARGFMQQHFADALAMMPDFEAEFAANPVGFLGTLYADRWHRDGRAVLLGDAAHAIVPFHGQGMNAAFEDTVALADMMEEHSELKAAFAAFQVERKPNADAIAAMALDNYLEMRDRVRNPRFHLIKELEFALEKRLPGEFIPRYSMVMFHPEIPYAEARLRGDIQARLLESMTEGAETMADIDLDRAALVAREALRREASE